MFDDELPIIGADDVDLPEKPKRKGKPPQFEGEDIAVLVLALLFVIGLLIVASLTGNELRLGDLQGDRQMMLEGIHGFSVMLLVIILTPLLLVVGIRLIEILTGGE